MFVPKLVAHRGDQQNYPENTLPAISAAIEAGAHFVEFDVQLAADRVPILMHDEQLRRTTGVDGRVFELTSDQLCTIVAPEPDRFGDTFSWVKIPSLSDAFAILARAPRVTVFVEIKEESAAVFGPRVAVDAVLNTAHRSHGQCVLISYDPETVRYAKSRAQTRVGWILHHWDESSRVLAGQLAPDFLICNVQKVPSTPQPFWSGPWAWVVYDVICADTALTWGRRGAAFVESFRITQLLADERLHGQGKRDEQP